MTNENNKNINVLKESSLRIDYSVVRNPARIAVYDDLKSPPHIIEVKPDLTNNFIEKLSSSIYDECHKKTSGIPYTVIREITENFIHANFKEIVVSILDNGNTIRFTDQGPGFSNIEKSQLPGFTSATEGMKQYIRGVGSGLPTVKDYIDYSNGNIKIENNLENGAVVTISLLENLKSSKAFSKEDIEKSNRSFIEKQNSLTPNLSLKEQTVLKLLLENKTLGVTEINKLSKIPNSSIHKILTSLEKAGYIIKKEDKKRILTDLGFSVVQFL